MKPHAAAGNLSMDIDGAVAEICEKAPEMREMVEAFATLARERQKLRSACSWLPPIDFDPSAFNEGEPILAGVELEGLHGCFISVAQKLLPVIERAFPHIASQAANLRSVLKNRPELGASMLEAVLAEGEPALDVLSNETGVGAESLPFLVLEVLKPCLGKAAEGIADLADDDLWCKGHCPVCGAGPDFGFLKEKGDPSEFLISKAGRLWLHCSLCGHVWRFVRLVCPACGEKDHEKLDVFTPEGRLHERIHACRTCRRYFLVMDLVERDGKFHPDLSPLGLIPLDFLAQEKGYAPLTRTAWNSLG